MEKSEGLTKAVAQSIFVRVFEGERAPDNFFHEALQLLGISRSHFYFMKREARKCERGRPAFVLCTPTGSGRNR